MKKRIKEIESGSGSNNSNSNNDEELRTLRQTHQTLQEEYEKSLANVKKLEAENKKHLEEINNLLKDSRGKGSEDSDSNNKLKAANDILFYLIIDI